MALIPSIVPSNFSTVYIVEDDFADIGRCYRETNITSADLENVIEDLIDGQYNNPVRVVSFNTDEGWSKDVSQEIAEEIQRRHDRMAEDVPSHLQKFVDNYVGPTRQYALRFG